MGDGRQATKAEYAGLLYPGQEAENARSIGHAAEEGNSRLRARRVPIAVVSLAVLALFALMAYTFQSTHAVRGPNQSVISQSEKLELSERGNDKDADKGDDEKDEDKEDDDQTEKDKKE